MFRERSAHFLASIGTRWIRDLGLGGLLGAGNINYLLDTAPLRQFLGDRLELARVAGHTARAIPQVRKIRLIGFYLGWT